MKILIPVLKKMSLVLISGLTVLMLSGTGQALTSTEIEQQIDQLEKELVNANRMVVQVKKIPEFRNLDLERETKEKLIYWSQKTVTLRNRIMALKMKLNEVRELEHYDTNYR